MVNGRQLYRAFEHLHSTPRNRFDEIEIKKNRKIEVTNFCQMLFKLLHMQALQAACMQTLALRTREIVTDDGNQGH